MPTAAGSGKQQPRSRRTLSFNSGRGSSTNLLSPGSDETAAVAAAERASGGRAGGQAAAAMTAAGAGSAAQVKAIRCVFAENAFSACNPCGLERNWPRHALQQQSWSLNVAVMWGRMPSY